MNWQWTSINSIDELNAEEFASLRAIENEESSINITSPFLSFGFLQALESSKSVGNNTGWQAQHIIIRNDNDELIAFLPAYIKTHSYGEYVFDHSWANAYMQHGLEYYPKLIIGVPFTPVTGPRILTSAAVSHADESNALESKDSQSIKHQSSENKNDNDRRHQEKSIALDVLEYIANQKDNILQSLSISSIHILFPSQSLSTRLEALGFHQRQSVQFNWHNKQYTNLDDFMQSLTARRRRSINKERKNIAKQGVTVKRLKGSEISEQHMTFFYRCYQQTYLKRSGHHGYLSGEFFSLLHKNMRDNLLLVLASRKSSEGVCEIEENKTTEKNIASSLFIFDENGLYGRYWGSFEEVSGLHFEACYYQGIEFCIENNIALFNPGTQGEHKILRGFEPTICYSNHSMKESAFDDAVKDFLQRETPHIQHYKKQSASLLPFKADSE